MARGAWGQRMLRLAPIVIATLVLHLAVRPVAASNPLSVIISNVRDTSFVVSWLTDVDEKGSVALIGGGSINDDRGAEYSGLTHYVTLSGLTPNSTYQFDIVSGGTRYDNESAHYSVMTGPTLMPPTPDLIVGRIQHSDGSLATNAIVLFTIQQEQSVSAPLSMLLTARDNGYFHVNLSDVRASKDPTHYFNYGGQTDLLTIQAVDARGMGTVRLPVSDLRLRSNDPSQTMLVQLSSPAEATPTLVQRLPTPTPIPAVPPQETGGLLVGVLVAATVVVGLVVIAIAFVWRR